MDYEAAAGLEDPGAIRLPSTCGPPPRQRSCRLVACANRIFRETDSIPDPDDFVELEEAVAKLRDRLGDRFDAVWAEGRALSEPAAQELARTHR